MACPIPPLTCAAYPGRMQRPAYHVRRQDQHHPIRRHHRPSAGPPWRPLVCRATSVCPVWVVQTQREISVGLRPSPFAMRNSHSHSCTPAGTQTRNRRTTTSKKEKQSTEQHQQLCHVGDESTDVHRQAVRRENQRRDEKRPGKR